MPATYSVVPVVAAGDWITAGWVNTYVGGNMAAMWPGTTAGDMEYYLSASEKARLAKVQGGVLYGGASGPAYTAGGAQGSILHNPTANAPAWLAKPSVDSVLRHTGGAVAPSWLDIGALPGLLHAKAIVNYNANDQVISSTSFADITDATVNIVTTRTCTIRMIAAGTFAAGGSGQRALVQGVIGGTGSGDMVHTSMTVYVPFTVVFYRTGVGAGTITCKLMGRGNAAGNSGIFHQGRIVVEAFVE